MDVFHFADSSLDSIIPNTRLKKSKEFSYWLGVAQSDGHLQKHLQKNRKSPRYYVNLVVSERSFPMFEKFRLISKTIFGTNANIFKTKGGHYSINVYVTKFIDKFEKLDIKLNQGFIPPSWIINNYEFFGSYLAGIIDGDGNVAFRRPKYPQCVIRIYSGKKETILIENLKKFLNCSISLRKRHKRSYFKAMKKYIEGEWFELEFVVSKKNYQRINKYVLYNLALKYKGDAIKKFIEGAVV